MFQTMRVGITFFIEPAKGQVSEILERLKLQPNDQLFLEASFEAWQSVEEQQTYLETGDGVFSVETGLEAQNGRVLNAIFSFKPGPRIHPPYQPEPPPRRRSRGWRSWLGLA